MTNTDTIYCQEDPVAWEDFSVRDLPKLVAYRTQIYAIVQNSYSLKIYQYCPGGTYKRLVPGCITFEKIKIQQACLKLGI